MMVSMNGKTGCAFDSRQSHHVNSRPPEKSGGLLNMGWSEDKVSAEGLLKNM